MINVLVSNDLNGKAQIGRQSLMQGLDPLLSGEIFTRTHLHRITYDKIALYSLVNAIKKVAAKLNRFTCKANIIVFSSSNYY